MKRMQYTTRVADQKDEAHVNYQCPCGCTAGLMYNRESGSLHLGSCCCGRLLWVGDDAEAIVRAKSESGMHYELDVSSVTLPWGETKTAALAIPTARVKPDLQGGSHDDHEGHSHPHDESAHDHEGHTHPHDEHAHDHDHEGHEHAHGHDHNEHEHHEHEHQDDGHLHVDRAAVRVRDVVCGMMIESASAAATSVYKGETYYFCALSCKQKFDAAPTQYVKPKGLLSRLFGRS